MASYTEAERRRVVWLSHRFASTVVHLEVAILCPVAAVRYRYEMHVSVFSAANRTIASEVIKISLFSTVLVSSLVS